ncbi:MULTISPECIES: 5'-nucleotidase, lipoprotein e(P4) family [Pseudomonas]|jgi:acid phosphatase|uniref:Acid phosphatase n=2 Tax=Pseudomonas TaxID=286 RepID=A0A7Y8KIP3_9PSED|nr:MULTISPECIES: HAD family acid phosphatase [Pseudomonas]KGE65541.1 acid phosphatase [Pseudomonas fluorescens LMG 5329]NWD84362.1 acid phosphatase [Pseudomonas reactans]NWE01576.1 acid phosphatase [Pseudomonas sp. IPO3749]NWE90956.1 acid phosphatase [Pseudomonas reactans]NWF22852.1 acid phosphatase [Pseudomonas sp. IPO3749]
MRNLFFSSVCLLSTTLVGCQQQPPANDQLDAVLWTQTSIEHELIYRQVFASATRQLDTALADPTWDALPLPPRNLAGLPPAVVVDIDETVLDNVPLNARDIRTNQVYSYDRWNTWVDQAKAQALPGAVEFLQAADQKGITVYYITNREHSQVQATVNNLRLRGFPVERNEQVLAASTPTGHCEQAGYGKNCRRQWVASHARVLMLAGDSFGDFVQAEHNTLADQRKAAAPYLAWLGQRWFLLPNPTYGNWYSAPYGDQEKLPFERKRQLKQQALHLEN